MCINCVKKKKDHPSTLETEKKKVQKANVTKDNDHLPSTIISMPPHWIYVNVSSVMTNSLFYLRKYPDKDVIHGSIIQFPPSLAKHKRPDSNSKANNASTLNTDNIQINHRPNS